MTKRLVLNLMGPDQPGIVDNLAEVIAAHGGNWEQSSMARLGGNFAGILLISVADNEADELVKVLESLDSTCLSVTVAPPREIPRTGTVVDMEIVGQDHVGIVHDISHVLASLKVNVDEFESYVEPASVSGGNVFRAHVCMRLPDGLDVDLLRTKLEDLASDLMVDLEFDVGG